MIKFYQSKDKDKTFFFSPYDSELLIVALNETEELKKINIAASSFDVTKLHTYKYSFSMAKNQSTVFKDSFEFIKVVGATLVTVLVDDGEDYLACSNSSSQILASSFGLNLKYYQTISSSSAASSNQSIVDALNYSKGHNVTSLIGCTKLESCVNIVKNAKLLAYSPQILFLDCLEMGNLEELVGSLGSDANFVMGMSSWSPDANITSDVSALSLLEFSDMYSAQFSIPASLAAVKSFARFTNTNTSSNSNTNTNTSSGELLTQAMRLCKSTDSAQLIETIMASSFSTIYGNLTFDESHMSQLISLVCSLFESVISVFYSLPYSFIVYKSHYTS